MNAHKVSLFFFTILFIHIQAAENNNPVFINTLSNCREIGWVLDGTILINAYHNNIPAIYGIKTNNDNQTEILCKFSNQTNALQPNSITLLDDARAAFISLQDSSIIYDLGAKLTTCTIQTQHRPTFIRSNWGPTHLVIMDYNQHWMVKSTSLFDGKELTPCENLNAAIKSNDHSECAFYNCITKHPKDNIFSAICQRGIYSWKPLETTFTLINEINDPTCTPLEFPTIVDELRYNCDGTLLAMTSEFCYSCFIYDTETKTVIAFQNDADKPAVEKARHQYEQDPSNENCKLLIDAGWKSQYPMDSKEFHPTIPYIIATFLQYKAELTYWNAKTAEIIIKQIVRTSMTNKKNSSCLQLQSCSHNHNKELTCKHTDGRTALFYPATITGSLSKSRNDPLGNPHLRLISFSPDGKQIACCFDDGVTIVSVPQEVLAYKH